METLRRTFMRYVLRRWMVFGIRNTEMGKSFAVFSEEVLTVTRTPARVTQADIARAMKVAVQHDGYRVRITKHGDILIERGENLDPTIEAPIASRPEFRL